MVSAPTSPRLLSPSRLIAPQNVSAERPALRLIGASSSGVARKITRHVVSSMRMMPLLLSQLLS
eukprot:1953730-Rhodomonas_salina.1